MCALRYKDEDGYYHNFVGNVEFHMDEPWYNVRDFLRVLRRMRKLDFSLPENRYKALCWLNGMCCTVPYGLTTRFPCRDFYITEARGCWGEILGQLKKLLADDCMIKFEVGKPASPHFGKKCKKSCLADGSDCAGNTECCNENKAVCAPQMNEYCEQGQPDYCEPQFPNQLSYCPITSDLCDNCLGPEPPSCCPDWWGNCEVKKIPAASFKCYIKKFIDIIEKMMKRIEKKDNVFSRKSFENYYKVIWTRCKRKCDILEDDDGDYICEDCCREEQEGEHCYQ